MSTKKSEDTSFRDLVARLNSMNNLTPEQERQSLIESVGKAPKGFFRFKRTDELAAETIQYMMNEIPQLDSSRIDDVIVGNAMPEGSQGLNMARLISLMGLKTVDVPGVTVNRFCSSGIETIGIATAKIQSGMADCIIAGGAESMSSVPMTGFKPELNYD